MLKNAVERKSAVTTVDVKSIRPISLTFKGAVPIEQSNNISQSDTHAARYRQNFASAAVDGAGIKYEDRVGNISQ